MKTENDINTEAWSEWEKWRRKEKRKKITPMAEKKQHKLLSKYDHETQRQIIDHSIMNDYQGLFPPKGVSNEVTQKDAGPKDTRRLSAVERVKQRRREARERDA